MFGNSWSLVFQCLENRYLDPRTMRTHQLLNGHWDFLPVLGAAGQGHRPPSEGIPSTGWLPAAMPVPGSWTRGESDAGMAYEPGVPWAAWRLFDNYGFPAEWDEMDTAWYRRSFEVQEVSRDAVYTLHFGGILRQAWVFLNGVEVGQSENGIMPLECDVTGVVREGGNKLVVYVTDYRRNAEGKTYTPFGADQMMCHKGIWQDVELRVRPLVRVEDVTIQTSVREDRLTVLLDVRNDTTSAHKLTPTCTVWDADAKVLSFEGPETEILAGETSKICMLAEWTDYRPWSHHDPHLYHLKAALLDRGESVDVLRERFGFREIWTDGPDLILNGNPVHLSGDWSHRMSMESLTTAYFRKWFGMLKDCNMNYVRTHTFPHPKNMLELADEMGMLVSLESGWHFGSGFALDEEEFWQGALQHVRDMVHRDKNHPSIILWSVGNEVRWSGNQPAIIENVPRLRRLYEELDPTRIAYHDGDSSLWDERSQHLLSRHYGLECTGEGWWDRAQPLHVGEIGKWHYGQPIDNTIWGDDTVFASFRACHKAVALECADQIEQARANGVCCVFPWNLSGLDNFRPWGQEQTFDGQDPEGPGIKPLRSAPYGSEFAWWDEAGRGYDPGVGFEITRHALRPVALLVREHLNRTFDDQPVRHTVTVVNDGPAPVRGELSVTTRQDTRDAWEHSEAVDIAPGRSHRVACAIPLPCDGADGEFTIVTCLSDDATDLDRHERTIRVSPASRKREPWAVPAVALLGGDAEEELLASHGVRVVRVRDLADLDAEKTPVLLVGVGVVEAGSTQNLQVRSFLEAGGRAVVLEQSCSLMPGLDIDLKPAERCHIRGGGGGLLAGFDADDFGFWGNDPYGRSDSDAWVVVSPYRKDSLPGANALLHSGQGDFGSDGLYWSPLIEACVGKGCLVASQLRIAEKADGHPVALALLKRFLEYAAAWNPPASLAIEAVGDEVQAALTSLGVKVGRTVPGKPHFADTARRDASPYLADARSLNAEAMQTLAERVAAGTTAILMSLDTASAERVADAFDVDLTTVDLGEQLMLLRGEDDPLLVGISHQETCWLEKMQYAKENRNNRLITDVLLRSSSGRNLLVSEHQSCWHEFYLQGACSERLRMPVVTHLLGEGPREHAAGLVRIPHGQGQLLLCQVPFPQDEEHATGRCFWTQLLTNLNVAFDASVLDGEGVKAGSVRSPGYPEEIGYMVDPDGSVLEEILRVGRPTEFRIHNHGLVYGFEWQEQDTQGGLFTLEPGRNPDRVVLVFQIHAGRPRTIRYAEDGLPDPTEQTLCDLVGQGTVYPHINGRAFEPVTLGEEGRGVIPDVDLNMDWNTVLLVWEPKGGSSLGVAWRDRQRHPEVEFAFMFKSTKFLSGAVHV